MPGLLGLAAAFGGPLVNGITHPAGRDFLQMGVTNGLVRPGGVTMLGSPVDLAAADRDPYLAAGSPITCARGRAVTGPPTAARAGQAAAEPAEQADTGVDAARLPGRAHAEPGRPRAGAISSWPPTPTASLLSWKPSLLPKGAENDTGR